MPVPPDLGALQQEIGGLRAHGDLARAAIVLRGAVAALRAGRGVEHPDTLEAVRLLADVLRESGEVAQARPLAEAVVTAYRLRYGDGHPGSITAMGTCAVIRHAAGDLAGAEEMYHVIAEVAAAAFGPTARPTLAALGNLAAARYARGATAEALALLGQVLEAQRAAYGPADPDTIRMTAGLGCMHRDAGDPPAARRLLSAALAGCYTGLTADDPLTVTVGRHLADLDTAPARQAGWTAHQDTAPPLPDAIWPDEQATTDAIAAALRRPGPPAPAAPPDPRTTARVPPPSPAPAPAPAPAATGMGSDSPATMRVTGAGAEGMWPVRPGGGADDSGGAGLSAGYEPFEPWPESRAARAELVPYPDYAPPRRRARIALVAGVAVLVVAGAVAGIVALGQQQTRPAGSAAGPNPGNAGSPTAGAPTPTPPAAPSPTPGPAPPGNVHLDDRGASIVVSWTDPSQGTVPFLIGSARLGQEPRLNQSADPGTTSTTIHGTNVGYDYCFVVAAVYSTSEVARANPVCTHRSTAKPGPSRTLPGPTGSVDQN